MTMYCARIVLVLSINMSLSTFAFGARVVLDKKLDMSADDFLAGNAELITWLNTTHTVAFDSNEHLEIGDTSWREWSRQAWTVMKKWSNDKKAGGSCFNLRNNEAACAMTGSRGRQQITKKWFQRITKALSSDAGGGEEGYYSFEDYLFLSGDFFADKKNGGNLEEPAGDDWMQKNPLQPLQDIIDSHTQSITAGVSGWSVPALISTVRSLVDQGEKYEGGDFLPFFTRQAQFVTLTGGRYKELAFANHNHFGVLAKREYVRYHSMALEEAFAAGVEGKSDGFLYAFQIEAMGAHYLTDLFSAGHSERVPRTQLQAICTDEKAGGIFLGTSMESKMPGGVPVAGFLTKMMHDEESQLGVKLEGVGEGTWTSYGDSTWFKTWAARNKKKANEAVVHSLHGVLYAFLDGLAQKPRPNARLLQIPYLADIQPTYPLFKVAAPHKAGHAIGLMMRVSQPTDPVPEYEMLDEDCVGMLSTGSCITCQAALPLAENAKAAAREVSAKRREERTTSL